MQNFIERLCKEYPTKDEYALRKIISWLIDEKHFEITDDTEIVPVPWNNVEVPIFEQDHRMSTKMLSLVNYVYKDEVSVNLICTYFQEQNKLICFKHREQRPANKGLQTTFGNAVKI